MNMSYGVQLCLPIEKLVIFHSYLSLSQGIVVALKNCPGCGGVFLYLKPLESPSEHDPHSRWFVADFPSSMDQLPW